MALPKSKVKIEWSAHFAYAIGLIVTDGCLSPDGRHILFVSKDEEQIETLQKALKIICVMKKKSSGYIKEKRYFFIQIGDVNFYKFLQSIGLTPNKSKTIGEILIPNAFFADFLRGHLDGDGHFYSYFDPRWKSSYLFYTVFNSSSSKHIVWLQKKIEDLFGLKGHVTKTKAHSCISLKYAKSESLLLLDKLYPKNMKVYCLRRKRLKILKALFIMPKR